MPKLPALKRLPSVYSEPLEPHWFQTIFGFYEPEYTEISSSFAVIKYASDPNLTKLCCLEDGRTFHLGAFETPSLNELQQSFPAPIDQLVDLFPGSLGPLRFRNIDGDVRALHLDPEHNGAVFQVASQLNALEMPGPNVTPEAGVSGYVYDRTQGPTCAMACPAALIYRNFFVHIGERGQGSEDGGQLDLAGDIAQLVDNQTHRYFRMRNGYLLPSAQNKKGIQALSQRLSTDITLAESVRDALRVAVHWSTQVWDNPNQRVAQVFCSALPVAYSQLPEEQWEGFARLVLVAAMDATLAVGMRLALQRQQRVKVFLTSLGGGAFGNPIEWIADAVGAALEKYQAMPLDVYMVLYKQTPPAEYRAFEKVYPIRKMLRTVSVVTSSSSSASLSTSSASFSNTPPLQLSPTSSSSSSSPFASDLDFASAVKVSATPVRTNEQISVADYDGDDASASKKRRLASSSSSSPSSSSSTSSPSVGDENINRSDLQRLIESQSAQISQLQQQLSDAQSALQSEREQFECERAAWQSERESFLQLMQQQPLSQPSSSSSSQMGSSAASAMSIE